MISGIRCSPGYAKWILAFARMTVAVVLSISGASATAAPATASGQYPERPIRMLVPFAPGGVVDTSTRILTNKLTERLGWQFVVDNRPGGNGFIAVQTAARGAPDGYTLLMAHTGEFAVNPAVFKDVPYDLERDFTPITMVSDAPMLVVVGNQSPIQSWTDLIATAKAKPGQLSYGSPGNGSVNHLATEWLASAAGIKLNHIPYKGGAPAVAAVAAGEVVLTVAGLPGVTPFLKPARVRVISTSTAKRTPQTSDWASAGDVGLKGVDASIWVGMFAPKGVPKAVVDRLYRETVEALKLADVKERYAVVGGAETIGMPPAEFLARIKKDALRYKQVVQTVGITPQ
jgi:tripartite-type tricarboxylate transporter receptor subunit TctC